jgi:hypothetical protein
MKTIFIPTFESYKSIKLLEELSDVILKKILEETLKNKKNKFEDIFLESIIYKTTDNKFNVFLSYIKNSCVTFKLYENNDILAQLILFSTICVYYKKEDYLKIIKNEKYFDYCFLYLKNKFKKSLVHELQHFYDYFISNGKSFTVKVKNKHDYYNLPYEINARFTDTISNIKFYEYKYDELNSDDNELIME